MSTQVFILSDKLHDANLILVSFRGTEPFDADDWSTDFDYSWYEIPNVGKVHMGFLEALGLGNRRDPMTFYNKLQQKNEKSGSSDVSSNIDSDSDQIGWDRSSDSETQPEKDERTAYYTVRRKLKSLLNEHKNAKFVVTGHSLGGALAIMFPTVLVLHEEMDIMERLMGVYTYGQPRIGNRQLGSFMEAHIENPVPKYFRMVYCNDLVPRLPYDDKIFLYKHFGVCLYYNSLYIEQVGICCLFSFSNSVYLSFVILLFSISRILQLILHPLCLFFYNSNDAKTMMLVPIWEKCKHPLSLPFNSNIVVNKPFYYQNLQIGPFNYGLVSTVV